MIVRHLLQNGIPVCPVDDRAPSEVPLRFTTDVEEATCPDCIHQGLARAMGLVATFRSRIVQLNE